MEECFTGNELLIHIELNMNYLTTHYRRMLPYESFELLCITVRYHELLWYSHPEVPSCLTFQRKPQTMQPKGTIQVILELLLENSESARLVSECS